MITYSHPKGTSCWVRVIATFPSTPWRMKRHQRGLFHSGQTKVCHLRRAARSDKGVGRFAVSVDDEKLAQMKVFHATRNIQNDVQL